MNSSTLSQSQAAALRDQLALRVDYLRRLAERMESHDFPPEDPLLLAARRALDNATELRRRAWVLPGDRKHKVDKREKQHRREPG